MQRNKKPKKKKADRPSLLKSEETLVTSLLEDFKNVDPAVIAARIPDSHLAGIFLERLPIDKEFPVPLLLALDETFKDKKVHKLIKRIMFRLKQKGVLIDESFPKRASHDTILTRVQKEEPVAYIGPIAGTIGSRAVLIVLQSAVKGYQAGIGLVSEAEGILQFLYGPFSKKRIREIKDSLSQEAGPLVKTSLPHAVTILETAYRRHKELHSDAPSQYPELRPQLLEKTTLLDRAIIYDVVPEIPDDGLMTDIQLEKLFGHHLMESWLIDFEDLKPFMEDILKVEGSPIVLSEAQKADQIRQIKDKSIEELFPGPERDRLKHNLEEMAYFFFRLDQNEYCTTALTAARNLDEEDTILRKNRIIDFLLERSMQYYMDLAGETDAEDEILETDDSPAPQGRFRRVGLRHSRPRRQREAGRPESEGQLRQS